ncbi:DUF58 domain-containing protein [Rarobacter faecitabidus]|uniref:Uncharacterized protein DUF58 n=1 Tax=Rarobacter faecitabidus TaxID=13243 RepID=A0A542ZNZ3_RARFA|nr:DUF58 domain-containing protein [Rarobacter faecitabidus]TQL62094.1 uncharacterized protein DUF58 [Rarobacter faecitabidus]
MNHQRLAEVRARLELPLLRRAAGLLEGHHRSIYKGHGQDFDDLSLYNPGDDIGDIDWKSSARAGIPIIRRFVRQSNLTTILAVDTGRRMGALAASGTEAKSAVATFLASIISYISRDRGDRVALVAGDAERLVQRPPRASTQDLEAMLHQLESLYGATAPAADLVRVLDRVEDAFQRRSLLIVMTDESGLSDDTLPVLRRLRMRHEVLVLCVADANPFDPAVGGEGNDVRDVDGGLDLPAFFRTDPSLRDETEALVSHTRAQTLQFATQADARLMVTSGIDDALADLIRLLSRSRHG